MYKLPVLFLIYSRIISNVYINRKKNTLQKHPAKSCSKPQHTWLILIEHFYTKKTKMLQG